MRCPILAALLFIAQSIVPGTASAAGEGACTGAACGALALSADGCAWTNTGDKSVRLSVGGTVGGSGKASPIVMILAPGEMFKASGTQCEKSASGKVLYDASFPTLRTMAGEPSPPAAKIAAPVPKMKPVAAAAVVVAPAAPTLAVATAAPRHGDGRFLRLKQRLNGQHRHVQFERDDRSGNQAAARDSDDRFDGRE